MTDAPAASPATRLLIDMDGTLVDSTAVVEQAWREFCDRHGIDFPTLIAHAHGRPTMGTLTRFLDDPAVIARESADLLDFELTHLEGIVEVPGAGDFIRSLPAGSWAFVTSATDELARRRMGAAGVPVPETCVFAGDITRGKPDPEPYLLAASRMGVPAEACVVLEDAPAGIEAGLAAGARVLVVGGCTDYDGRLPRVPDLRGLTLERATALASR